MQYDRLTAPTTDAVGPSSSGSSAQRKEDDSVFIAALVAGNAALRTELGATEMERMKLLDTQRRIMELLGTESADRLLHDVRNLLNERALLRALVAVE